MNGHGMETSEHPQGKSEAHTSTGEVMDNDSDQWASVTFLSICIQPSLSKTFLISLEAEQTYAMILSKRSITEQSSCL
jgi:hypothetical protein